MNFEVSHAQSPEREPLSTFGKAMEEAEASTAQGLLLSIQKKIKGVDDLRYAQFLISDDVETLLRYRISKEAVAPLIESLASAQFTEDDYSSFVEKITESINEESSVARFRMSGWLACQAIGENGALAKFPSAGESEIDIVPKEYWTFAPLNQEGALWRAQVELFLQQLPKIIVYLRDELKLEFFGVKVPDRLSILLRHRDSLVIHYPDPALKDQIRNKIDNLFGEAGIEMDKHRTRLSGFDFQWKNSSRNEAYSTVVGKVAARKLAEVAVVHPECVQSREEIQELIQIFMKEIESLEPEELLSQFTKD